jgi:hypothetical protein
VLGPTQELGVIFLACTVYSMGVLGVPWQELPREVQAQVSRTATGVTMRDQTMANVVYGLALMDADISKLDAPFREAILRRYGEYMYVRSGPPPRGAWHGTARHDTTSTPPCGVSPLCAAWRRPTSSATWTASSRCLVPPR